MVRMTIELPESIETDLKLRAEREGKSVEQVASDVVSRAMRLQAFEALCAENSAGFKATGLSEDEFMERYVREEHAARGVPYDDE